MARGHVGAVAAPGGRPGPRRVRAGRPAPRRAGDSFQRVRGRTGETPHPSSEKAVGEGPTWQWEVRGTPLRAPGEALGSARSWHRGSILPAPTLLHSCGGLTGNLNVG